MIAYALLIVCRSLFEVVIRNVAERGKIIITFQTVYTVIGEVGRVRQTIPAGIVL